MVPVKVNAAESVMGLIPEKGSIGLGSGSTVAIFASKLGERIESDKVDISVVPSSYQAYQLAVEFNIEAISIDFKRALIDNSFNISKSKLSIFIISLFPNNVYFNLLSEQSLSSLSKNEYLYLFSWK